MASRSAGTLLTQYNAAYVPPGLMPGYHGHVPNVAFSFADTYGNTTMKYFQDFRSALMETCRGPYSKGGQFPTLFSPDPGLVIGARARGWDRWLHTPNYSRYNLDINRTAELKEFYKLAQMHREHYMDKTGTVHPVPYFVIPVKEKEKYPHPLDLS
ncbi:ciliary microtubule inner protein 2C isoform X1 [Zootoca vivipara]|uniref:ciliary microtubule inner protein 2C isoform X1 n=1 Tax=Zootoca vivipara TaxID=8524 RepID=UPI00293BCB01|nr:ciliary microtubule inner protein 2C isoform X1 [Zootoca vivipara]